MRPSPNCEALVRQFEGFRPTAYKGADGIWTCGIGHTKDVNITTTCTLAQADAWFVEDSAWAAEAVNDLVKVPLNQNQFDALVSFVFNIGRGAFAISGLLTTLNKGEYATAAAVFDVWVYVKKRKTAGLVARRAVERSLFEKPLCSAMAQKSY